MASSWLAGKRQIVLAALAALVLIGAGAAFWLQMELWVPAALGGLGLGLIIASLTGGSGQGRGANPLRVVDTEFVKDDRETTTHKRKLYIVLINSGKTTLVLGPGTTWTSAELEVTTPSGLVWALEGPKGWRNNDWSRELVAIALPPGKHGRTFIGLPVQVDSGAIESSTQARRAGRLTIPISAPDQIEIAL
jgi:hypothetical protein